MSAIPTPHDQPDLGSSTPPAGGPRMKPGLKLYQGHPAARDLREMTQDDLRKAGHPLQALRTRCLDCCGYQEKEVALCSAVDCPFWPFRMGTDPLRKPTSEARREAARRVMSDLNARRRKGLVLNLPPAVLHRSWRRDGKRP